MTGPDRPPVPDPSARPDPPARSSGIEPGGVEPGGVEPGGVEPAAIEPLPAEAGALEPAGPAGVEPAAGPGGDGSADGVGSVVDEAARLAEAAGDWVRRALPEVVAVLRGERPEVTDRLAEAGAAIGSAARALLSTVTRPPLPPADPPGDPDALGGPPAGPDEPGPPGRRVEPIDVE